NRPGPGADPAVPHRVALARLPPRPARPYAGGVGRPGHPPADRRRPLRRHPGRVPRRSSAARRRAVGNCDPRRRRERVSGPPPARPPLHSDPRMADEPAEGLTVALPVFDQEKTLARAVSGWLPVLDGLQRPYE